MYSPGYSTAFGASARQLVLGHLTPDDDSDKWKRGSSWTAATQQWWQTVMMGMLRQGPAQLERGWECVATPGGEREWLGAQEPTEGVT
jgi:hypothetical protein